jgi:hypothetical protein
MRYHKLPSQDHQIFSKVRTKMSVLLLFNQFAPRPYNVVSKSNALQIEAADHQSSPPKQLFPISSSDYRNL